MEPKASRQQVRLYFSLGRNLGYEALDIKERAKKKYHLTSFTEITTQQLSTLIDLLLEQQEKRQQKPTSVTRKRCPVCDSVIDI